MRVPIRNVDGNRLDVFCSNLCLEIVVYKNTIQKRPYTAGLFDKNGDLVAFSVGMWFSPKLAIFCLVNEICGRKIGDIEFPNRLYVDMDRIEFVEEE